MSLRFSPRFAVPIPLATERLWTCYTMLPPIIMACKYTVTWLHIDLGNASVMPDPGVPRAAVSARLGTGGEGGLGQAGESGMSV